MNSKLDFGLSPCPNDTYIFYHFIHTGKYNPIFLDVEELNQLALKEEIPLIKVSCITAVQLQKYEILSSGGAIGYRCGPLIVSSLKNQLYYNDFINLIYKYPIYIPGKHTTANFLFYQFCKYNNIPINQIEIHYIRYDKIIPELKKNNAFGVLIHEERFCYQNHNLKKIIDLGEWWEETTHLPIPLGCIVLHKDYIELKDIIENDIKQSIEFSKNNYHKVLPFIKKYAQSMDETIIKSHIDLYVTDFSYDMKDKGKQSLFKLKEFVYQL
ncbi:MAG: 1,4-dihydroxy-6-naphtoate synthase [Leptospiraceae bacterium]|nr:MAG: 1,4-dihydroxy-6-naphtoate synthase [Leptospiraceae bacterium]